jgi:ABC-type antimicrobial peptide transport system permease subunit
MMSLFAALGLLTAVVGLYGVLTYAVTERTSEIGVRMALGADAGDVRRLVLTQALGPVLVGLLLGSISAQWVVRFIASQLYRVKPYDPLTIGAVVGLFLVLALAAAYVPTRRATRIDPLVALRTE